MAQLHIQVMSACGPKGLTPVQRLLVLAAAFAAAVAAASTTHVLFSPVHGARAAPIQVMRGPYMARGCVSGLVDCSTHAAVDFVSVA
jgi:hypothetical protein